jgi:hypothetical protein
LWGKRGMKSGKVREGRDVSLLIHLWQERSDRRWFWRGHVTEVDGERQGSFEDARGLVTFLRKMSGVMLPMRRGRK